MNKDYFIEDFSYSEDENNFNYSTWKPSGLINRDDSPPAILAYSISSGRDTWGQHSPEQEGSSDEESVEKWMMLDEDPEEGDSTIQLNLSFSISSEEDSNHEDKNIQLFQDQWAVSKIDKDSGEDGSICRYFMPDRSLFCPICKRTGHLAKSCQLQKKCPICVLCGIQGHLQKECPSRPCSRCGLLSHGVRAWACDRLPVWNQHCQRCGLMGHLSDLCPDIWRQYHHTVRQLFYIVKNGLSIWHGIHFFPIQISVTKSAIRIQRAIKQKKRFTYCYNCSRRGHYGHVCSLKRMTSGTFFTLPYVYRYDSNEKNIESGTRNGNKEITNEIPPLAEQQQLLETFEEKDKDAFFLRRTKMGQKAQASGRKTWPERRRERQEVKRLRREAQTRREGGLMGHCQDKSDDDILYLDPFGNSNPWQYRSPSKKAYKTLHQRNKNSRKTQREHLKRRWRKKT
ncbi:uncharacterized protein [Eucyclogobius newberryi]|uniref:uncharacterized protein isoform X2 n=1 Tax=Eucyclogobius newberryi TaxID=166745 RepID=UPI003B58FE2C